MQEYTKETYLQAYREFMRMTSAYGIPEETGKMMAASLRSERALRRMTSYLRNVRPDSMELIADEMLAIMEDCRNWRNKKQAEESSRRYNEWLNTYRPDDEDYY